MSNNNEDRLSKIEALLESVAQQHKEFTQGLQALDNRINSNAKAIEALSERTADYQRDRDRMYQLMSSLATVQAESQSNLANVVADTRREMYQLMSRQDQQFQVLSHRQGEITEILKLLTKRQ